ncbi:MAG TPA: MFS transporter [Polyangiaceae bacterium]|nr:MFS transporter [Polyangiaceae bacterium]
MQQRAPLLPIFLIVLVDIFGLTIIIPLLSIYSESFGASPLEATMLVSVFALCQLVSGPLLGRASDRVGRKPLLVASQVGTLIGFLVLARASALWMVYLSRIIDGSTAGNISLAQAYISDNTDPKDRTKSFALIGIAFGLGFFMGPFLTGYLVNYGLHAPIYAAAMMSFTSIVCTLTLLPDTGPPKLAQARDAALPGGKRLAIFEWSAYTQFFARPVLSGLLAQFFFYALCFSTFTSGFALFAERRFTWDGHPFTPREIGFLLAYVGLLGIILQGGLIGRLVKRFGEPALVTAGFASLVVGYVILGPIHDIPPLVLVSTISSFGNGVLRPTLSSLVSQHAGRHEQGVALGLNQSLNSVAQIIAPIVGGLLIGRGQLTLWAWIAAGGAFVGLVATRWGSSLAGARSPAQQG